MTRRGFLTGAAAAALAQAQPETLFDGKTLRGWTVEQGPASAFYVSDGAIVVHESASYPAWLRSERQYENFDFRGEFFVKGWSDSGIYIHAPLYGRPTWEGVQVKIFHAVDEKPQPNSMGALFPLVAPRTVNVKKEGQWNSFRIRCDWPALQVWINGELVQDVKLDAMAEFRHRRRSGYLGFAGLTYPVRFRNLTVEELPGREKWEVLYGGPADLAKWKVSEGEPNFRAMGAVLRGDGMGHLATRDKFRDFELRAYIRGPRDHNGGVMFRTSGHGNKQRHYEIQLHNVEDAHFPTGSLYHFQRSRYVRVEPGSWFPFHLIVEGERCVVRIDGETVMEYDGLKDRDEGSIELQAHRRGVWMEYQDVRVKRLYL